MKWELHHIQARSQTFQKGGHVPAVQNNKVFTCMHRLVLALWQEAVFLK